MHSELLILLKQRIIILTSDRTDIIFLAMRNVALRLINTILKSLAAILGSLPRTISVQDYFILNKHFTPQILLIWWKLG